MGPWGVASIVFFVSGAFCGFLLTALLPMHPETWWLWPAVRTTWHLGGALWCGWAIATQLGQYRVRLLSGAALLGAALSFNALLDLARGPLVVEGRLVDAAIERRKALTQDGGRVAVVRQSIHGGLTIEAHAGRRHTLRPAGLQANRLEHLLAACASEEATLQALRHLGVVMTLQCVQPPGD